ncbi:MULTISPECIES: ZIP family metal transporter [unclassified Butyrivibrio]|jgi:ZIP family zinc transporter|uniref:ZIP family metal transporter n=1 Tax=unclassified Butyrivibrio TaxID=2639466 RepID=UPI00041288B3|nr:MULTISPECIES: ZIP family metal transporter [unclassified Butyrivibrio]SCX96871.1 zinc transporter, ZIP family [Butyrivibrio sp. INlla14]
MWNILIIPFLGTTLGAASVFLVKREIGNRLQRGLTGFASGVMVSASFFSLLLPALELSNDMGKLGFIPASIGFGIGMLFLLFMDMVIPHMHLDKCEEGPRTGLKRTTKLVLAVTLHNLPEGMAVGIVCAGWMYGNSAISFAGALALAIGIALQNFPEGAIVSMPLLGEGVPKGKTFLYGMLSGIVEPIGALLVIFASGFFIPLMPYLLSFAAGAMIYVVVEELIPEMSEGVHSNVGTISFAMGFILMMALDIGLG